MLHVAPATVANWIDGGHLKGHKTPTGRRRVDSADLVEFLKGLDMPIPPELVQAEVRDVVVVVDDDAAYLDVLVRTIEASDLEVDVVEATTGMDALLEIGRHQPGLIVLDFRLPDLNAVQVVERLLEPGGGVNAEVMVVTGGVTEEEQAALRRVGVKVIVSKADGMPAVIEAMRRALKRPAAA